MSLPFLRPGRAARAPAEVRARGRAWAASHRLAPVSDSATVTFAIRLISAERAYDWGRVQRRLRATLAALRAQTSPRWQAVICGQDRPKTEFDAQVRFLPFDQPVDPSKPTDQHAKTACLVDHLSQRAGNDGYFFLLDADDLIHPRLVEHVVTSGERAGFLITRGYMLDAQTGRIAYHGENRLRYRHAARFSSHCGSCSAIRMDNRAAPAFHEPLTDRGPHGQQMNRLAAYGMALKRLPFAGAIYLVNHGENMRVRRGKGDTKLRYLERNQLPEAARDSVMADFGLERILATP